MTAAELFALLVFGHFLADYPLQGEFIALGKNRTCPLPGTPWYQILLAHAFMHGGLVAAAIVLAGISGHPALFALAFPLAIAETIVHFAIDDWKCRREARLRKIYEGQCDVLLCKRIAGYDIDQALHFACKAAWTVVCAIAASMPILIH
jgi:hypothetical protein